MRKNDIYETEIVDMGVNGEGIAKIDGIVVFVPYAIVGEVVKIKIVYGKKDYAYGEIVEILQPSPFRVKPKCIHFGVCGGCDLQHIAYEKQLELKKNILQNNLKKIGGIEIETKNIQSANEWKYRNKLSLPFGLKNGKVVLGFYEKKSHQVVPMKDCLLHDEWAKKMIFAVTTWANQNEISVFDEKTQKGFLRHAVARKIDTLVLTIVGNGKMLPKVNELATELKQQFDEFEIHFSSNQKNSNVILGETEKLVFGKETKQKIGKLKAIVSPLSFLQINEKIRDAIYEKVAEIVEEEMNAQPNTNLVELYSGIGILTAELAIRLPNAKITAVEIVKDAVKNADALMMENGLQDRVKNVCNDASYAIEKIEMKNSIVIVDPPRKGCSNEVLQSVLKAMPKKVLYISCNPATLARDAKILSEKYVIREAIPYDMFPQTKSLETLACFELKTTETTVKRN